MSTIDLLHMLNSTPSTSTPFYDVTNTTSGDGNNTCVTSSCIDGGEINTDDVAELRQTLNTAQYVVAPLLLVVGLFGNFCTVLTVLNKSFQKLTSRYILCALAFSDSLLLLTNIWNQHFMISMAQKDLRILSNIGCKIFFISYRFGKLSASWFIVLIATERFFAVLYPLKVKTIMTKRTIAISIATVYVVIFSLMVSWRFSTSIVNGICRSDVPAPDEIQMHKNFVVIAATFYSLAPICILSTITPPIVYKLIKQQREHTLLRKTSNERQSRDISRASFMLVGVVINYVICVMPITLILILTFWTNEPIFETRNRGFMILLGVAQIFEQINHSSNFIIYVMCGRQFRDGFLRIICCKQNQAHETQPSARKAQCASVVSVSNSNSNQTEVEDFKDHM